MSREAYNMCRQITLSAIHKKISSKEIQKRQNIAMSAAEPSNDQFLTVNLAFFLNKGSAPFVCPLNNIPTCYYGEKKAFLTLPLFLLFIVFTNNINKSPFKLH